MIIASDNQLIFPNFAWAMSKKVYLLFTLPKPGIESNTGHMETLPTLVKAKNTNENNTDNNLCIYTTQVYNYNNIWI